MPKVAVPKAGDEPLRVAIIGAGVAGLACAVTLERSGLETVVYEQGDKPGPVFANVSAVMPVVHRPVIET